MRRFLIAWLILMMIVPFLVAWLYHQWDCSSDNGRQEQSLLKIDVQTAAGVQRMGVTDFLTGAVAGQIPADFELETLKAQAVMARTCLYAAAGKRNFMAASETGMTWCSEETRKKMWGTKYQSYLDKIDQAVQETDGEVIYDAGGQMILPAWFYMGSGKTRSSNEAWGMDIPWFQSVASEWDTEAEDYETTCTMTKKQMIDLLQQYDSDFSCQEKSLASSCAITGTDSAGYVTEIQVGNQWMKGEDFRYALNLPSACFRIAFEKNQVHFTVYGQGQGVGLDQYGANRQAQEGKNYKQLLQYYLTGVKVGE